MQPRLVTSQERGYVSPTWLLGILVAITAGSWLLTSHLEFGRSTATRAGTVAESRRAHDLVTLVNIYRHVAGKAVAGPPSKPMTIERANAILAEIKQVTVNGHALVDREFVFGPRTTFPPGWGESAPGVFDPVP